LIGYKGQTRFALLKNEEARVSTKVKLCDIV